MADADRAPDTRPSLLVRLRDAADTDAWGSFVDVYGPLVYGECRRRGLRHQDAEDVTQRVFACVLRGIRRFEYEPDRGRFRDWLGIVVRNETFRFAKGSDGFSGRTDLDDIAAPDLEPEWAAAFHDHLLRVALDRCRSHFEPPTWAAFERTWLDNCPAIEVAREFGRPVDWVYVAKSRVLKRLEQTVRELADDWPLADGQ